MGQDPQTTIRRLGPGDEDVVRRLAENQPQTALLADDRTVFLVAFAGDEPVGFAFGYVLPRRYGKPTGLFVYELAVDEAYRRQGIGRRLMQELLAGQAEAYVLTEPGERRRERALRVARRHACGDGDVGLLSYRAATDADVPLLVGWYADPDVSRYWDDETFTEDEMRARLARERVDAWILEEDGAPVGYLQSWWEDDDPRRGGLDGFLIPSARGRGIMPALARQLAERLLAEGWQHVTVDPYAWNERALRGWANAGFVEISRHPADDEHNAEWVLMRFGG